MEMISQKNAVMSGRRKRRLGKLLQLLLILILVCVITTLIITGITMTRCERGIKSSNTKSEPHTRPNILYILVDDLGYNDLGYHNNEMKTPNIDALGENGRVLNQHYMLHICSPSRHALMTGRYPFKARMQKWPLLPHHRYCSPTDLPFLSEKLKEEGYNTHLVGKWHLGFCQDVCTPTHRGFDTFYGMLGGMEDHFGHYGVPPEPGLYDWFDNNQVDFQANGTHTTDLITNRALQLLTEHDYSHPFFMLASYPAPHFPVQAPQKYIDMFSHIENEGRRNLSAMMAHLDDRIKDLIDGLKRNGLYTNTLIIFTGDNGGDVAAHHDNFPLRGGKTSLWEGGTRILAFISGPLVQNPGHIHDGLMHVTDWYATILSLAGAPHDKKSDGLDQSDMILRGRGSRRSEFIYNIDMQKGPSCGQVAIRVLDYKLIWGYEGLVDGWGMGASPIWKYKPYLEELGLDTSVDIKSSTKFMGNFNKQELKIMHNITMKHWFEPNYIHSGNVHLFNIADDPEERHDLATQPRHQERVMDMKQRVLELLSQELQPKEGVFTLMMDDRLLAAADRNVLPVGWCHASNLSLAASYRTDQSSSILPDKGPH